jgi:DNA-binding beta-propeller fold protein YncE
MRKRVLLPAVALLAFGPGVAAQAQERTTTVARAADSERPAGIIVDTVKVVAEVKAIDYEKRTVTLALPSGEMPTFTVSEEAVNFPQTKVGDTVELSYLESLAVAVLGPAEEPIAGAGAGVVLAPVGAKPGGVVVASKTLTARVTAIDQATRMVTLTGPEGNTRTIKVGPDVKRLAEVRAGDQVTMQYTEAVAIDVQPAAKPAAAKQ